MKQILFKGCATALVTPFKNGKVDYDALKTLINKQLEASVDAIVILGTTGEPCTITQKERTEIIKYARNLIPNDTKLIVGAGTNDTKKTIKQTLEAKNLGADGVLVVTPYYNKCSENGLFLHYKAISDAVDLPIIAYNVPSRTGVNITCDMAEKLSTIKNVVGIKEASGNIQQINKLFSTLGDKLAIYSGDDELNYIFLSLGACGVISVMSNIIPKKIQDMCKFAFCGKYKLAKKISDKYYFLSKKLFLETNPIPVKTALGYIGTIRAELRMPLCSMTYQNAQILKEEIKRLGLTKNDCM